MSERTRADLIQKQSLPLSLKVRLTMERVRQWVNEYGEDGVYVSFSGGKDSTVLLDIVRNKMGYKDVPAVFVDVPTQFPELKSFAKTWDNVEILKPRITFMQICEQYGFPLISKEVSECINGAKTYLTQLIKEEKDDAPYKYFFEQSTGTGAYNTTNVPDAEKLAAVLNERMLARAGGSNQRLAIVLGMLTNENTIEANPAPEKRSILNKEKWSFLLEAPFDVSNKCCNVMKKEPLHKYAKETGRKPITAQMAVESRLRTKQWLQNGCNGFNMKSPISNPMSFWTENDVLQYIAENHLPICSVYGEVVEESGEQLEGQMSLADFGFGQEDKKYKTTGCKRTGCMLCGFGCHLDKSPNRFEMLKESHPKMYALLDVIKNNGITMREAIDWINEHGNMEIKY